MKLRQDEMTLPSEVEITYTVIEPPGFVVIVPVLADGRVVMEHVYRHPIQRTLLECPSGGLDGEASETAARRELEEETGYRARSLRHLACCSSAPRSLILKRTVTRSLMRIKHRLILGQLRLHSLEFCRSGTDWVHCWRQAPEA